MKKNFDTDENPVMIITGILSFYILVASFVVYFYLMHKIGINICILLIIVFTLIYFPRFTILKNIIKKNDIKVSETEIKINNEHYNFDIIEDFKVEEKKPQVVFCLSNKMIIYSEAFFYLKTVNGVVKFSVYGSEKIELLKSFLDLKIKQSKN